MKKILFLHGLESKPGGAKPTFLERNGYEVVQPPLDKSEFEGSVNIAQRYYDETKPEKGLDRTSLAKIWGTSQFCG